MNDDAIVARDWKILVVGIGGVGGYFGGLLARYHGESTETKDSGGTVTTTFVARGAHLEAIQKHGLLLNTAEQSGLICRPDRATCESGSLKGRQFFQRDNLAASILSTFQSL